MHCVPAPTPCLFLDDDEYFSAPWLDEDGLLH